jgi:hypothetical protein
MASFLPYVIPGNVVPGEFISIPRLGFSRQVFVFDKIEADPVVHPDVVEKVAKQHKSRLGDENMMKAMRQMFGGGQKPQVQTDPMVKALPSSLEIRK